jgi:hypothetical protein
LIVSLSEPVSTKKNEDIQFSVIRSESANYSEEINEEVIVKGSAPVVLPSSRQHEHWGTSTREQLNFAKEQKKKRQVNYRYYNSQAIQYSEIS